MIARSQSNWLPESDAPQNGNGFLFEFPFGQLNTTKGEKRLLPRESLHDETDSKIRRPKTWTIKDRLALAQECNRKLLAFPELSRKTIAKQLGFTVVRLNQIMELLKLVPAIQNRLLKSSVSTDARLTEETLRRIAALADPKRQWLRLRALD